MSFFTPNDELLSKALWFMLFFCAQWYGSLFFQSFYLHRFLTHGQFAMSVFWQNVCQVGSFLCSGSSYMSPIAYAKMHTAHHLYADTEQDPHPPKYFSNPILYMWHTYIIYGKTLHECKYADMACGKGWRQMEGFDRLARNSFTKIVWVIVYAWIYVMLFPFCWMTLPFVIPFFLITVLMGPFHGFLVNWCAHKYGYKNPAYETDDDSRNVIAIDILLLGEWLHRNHHSSKGSYTFALTDKEFDPIGSLIPLLDYWKVIRLPT